MPNRLAQSSSPYLRQHADNPIDWFPWGDEAFDKARREDKPVLLSVGYSSCHWCHVMAHESFEDHAVASLLNDHFVSVKVDREERPDVDEAYMTAVQLSSGRGGWPMTLFLTPDKEPFFAATYLPRDNRGSSPGFLTVAQGVAEGWKTSRAEFGDAARAFAEAIREAMERTLPSHGTPPDTLILGCLGALAHDFDRHNGGFGGAPKFPPHTAIELLLAIGADERIAEDSRRQSLEMADATLAAMAVGGIRDHVGGGFHRYSTDATWLLPHFEKMLVDNALMLANYADAARILSRPEYAKVAEEIVSWLGREMRNDEGLFCAALDADSEGEEGRFYVWKWDETLSLLADRGVPFMEAYGFAPNGNFEDEATGRRLGANIPHLPAPAGSSGFTTREFEAELHALLEARSKRPRPMLDDKVLVGQNGLMIAALTKAGRIDWAAHAAHGLLAAMPSGGVSRQVVAGRPVGEGFLDDYAGLAYGLLTLAKADPDGPWLSEATRLAKLITGRFWDPDRAAFSATNSSHENLFGRSQPVFDQPAPSATALACRVLLRVGETDIVAMALTGATGWMERAPTATEALHLALLESAMPSPSPSPVEVFLEWEDLARGIGYVKLNVAEGWHLYGPQPAKPWMTPTSVELSVPAEVEYPPEPYTGSVKIPFSVSQPGTGPLQITVHWQACTDRECQAPASWTFSTERPLNG